MMSPLVYDFDGVLRLFFISPSNEKYFSSPDLFLNFWLFNGQIYNQKYEKPNSLYNHLYKTSNNFQNFMSDHLKEKLRTKGDLH